jgi:hypothetical protein
VLMRISPSPIQVTPDDPVSRSISTDFNDTAPTASLTASGLETGSGSRLNADAAEACPIHEHECSPANEKEVDESEPKSLGEQSDDEEQRNHEKDNDDDEADIDAEIKREDGTMTAVMIPVTGIMQVTVTPLVLTRTNRPSKSPNR